jgi:16S rRNA processing protein RimM
MENTINVGKIVATFGIDGQIILVHALGKKSNFKDVEFMLIEETKGSLLPYFIKTASAKTETESYILFEGIASKEAAKRLLNKQVWMPNEVFRKLTNKQSPIAMIGYSIIANGVSIGNVMEVIEQPHQILLTVLYKNNEAYIPMHQDNVIEINHKNQQILLTIPEGLLEIYG